MFSSDIQNIHLTGDHSKWLITNGKTFKNLKNYQQKLEVETWQQKEILSWNNETFSGNKGSMKHSTRLRPEMEDQSTKL